MQLNIYVSPSAGENVIFMSPVQEEVRELILVCLHVCVQHISLQEQVMGELVVGRLEIHGLPPQRNMYDVPVHVRVQEQVYCSQNMFGKMYQIV